MVRKMLVLSLALLITLSACAPAATGNPPAAATEPPTATIVPPTATLLPSTETTTPSATPVARCPRLEIQTYYDGILVAQLSEGETYYFARDFIYWDEFAGIAEAKCVGGQLTIQPFYLTNMPVNAQVHYATGNVCPTTFEGKGERWLAVWESGRHVKLADGSGLPRCDHHAPVASPPATVTLPPPFGSTSTPTSSVP